MIALSAAWAVVVGAAIGALAGMIGTAFAEWRAHRRREKEALADVCARLLAESINAIIGTQLVPLGRGMGWIWQGRWWEQRAQSLEALMERQALAKSQLDLAVEDGEVREAADRLLERTRDFASLVLVDPRNRPDQTQIDAHVERIRQAREHLRAVMQDRLGRRVKRLTV